LLSKEDYVLAYAKKVYGAKIFYRNRAIYIKTQADVYKIDLHLANESIYRFISMTKPLVLTETCLARGFFRVCAFSTYKDAQKIPTNKDWEKFLNDAYKYIAIGGLNE
jgi:hypothetical protein